MSKRRNEFIVGVVVLAAIALLIVGLLWLNRVDIGRKSFQVTVSFEDAGGLRSGDPVTVSGFDKGKVKSISLNPGKPGIVALLLIDYDVVLKKDAQFWLSDASLMGDKRVAVYPGSSSQLFDAIQTVEGRRSPGLMETMVRVGYLAEETSQLVGKMKNDMVTPENIKNISSALKNLNEASHQLNLAASQNRAAITETVTDANRLISGNKDKIDGAIMHLAGAGAQLDSIASKINSGQGTAGQLVNNKELYEDLKKTNKQLQDLITDIKANPKKYLTVKVF
jgi:phospholipid/cholesterol/gamma-HCH transport system substrate-binding protein